jgi:hypothetical protein
MIIQHAPSKTRGKNPNLAIKTVHVKKLTSQSLSIMTSEEGDQAFQEIRVNDGKECPVCQRRRD